MSSLVTAAYLQAWSPIPALSIETLQARAREFNCCYLELFVSGRIRQPDVNVSHKGLKTCHKFRKGK